MPGKKMTEEERKASGRKKSLKYSHTNKGKAYYKKYRQSSEYRASQKKHTQTAKFKAGLKKYHRSDKFKAIQKKYAQSAKGRAVLGALAAKRRARRRSATQGDLAAIAAIYSLAVSPLKVICYICNKPIRPGYRSVDHVKPLSKGGSHSASNLAIVHAKCNSSKGAKDIQELGLLF